VGPYTRDGSTASFQRRTRAGARRVIPRTIPRKESAILRTATRHGLARLAVPAILFVAVLLRVSTLNERGVWRDEVYTIELLHLPFTKMMAAIRDTEGTPPL